jgi:hypothetical protein
MTGCAASTADGFVYLMSSSAFFTTLGCRFIKSEFFCQPGAIGCSMDRQLKMVALGGG